jgi:hypothetical protein
MNEQTYIQREKQKDRKTKQKIQKDKTKRQKARKIKQKDRETEEQWSMKAFLFFSVNMGALENSKNNERNKQLTYRQRKRWKDSKTERQDRKKKAEGQNKKTESQKDKTKRQRARRTVEH